MSVSYQRRTAARLAVEREAANMPLFPELRKWNTVEERLEWGDKLKASAHDHYENAELEGWVRATRTFNAMSDELADHLVEVFNGCSASLKNVYYGYAYFNDLLHQVNVGRK